jgi:hypothetical protein
MKINRMLGTEEAVVVGTEGGLGPTGVVRSAWMNCERWLKSAAHGGRNVQRWVCAEPTPG